MSRDLSKYATLLCLCAIVMVFINGCETSRHILLDAVAYVDSLRAADYIWKAKFDMDKWENLRLQSKRFFLQGPLIRIKLIFGRD